MSHRPLWLVAAPSVFLLLWSAGFGVAKLGLQHANPMTLLALRYVRSKLKETGLFDNLDMIADPDDPRDLFGMLLRSKG